MSSISPPPLTPAPHIIKNKLHSSSDPYRNPSSLVLNEQSANSYSQHEDLTDAYLEISCLKSTLDAKNAVISSYEETIKRLKAKSAGLELKLGEEKLLREKQSVKLARLQTLMGDSARTQEAHRNEITNLEAEVKRLQTLIAKRSVASDCSAVEMPMKKRKKMLHKCSNCDYSTVRGNAMKIHREEGCASAVVDKGLSCDVCKGKFTYNTYRYHLNQYTKKSSHAKNGHQKFTPEQHRQMLDKLKQTKQ